MPRPNDKKPPSNEALKYSGMAFKMAAIIGIFVYGGLKLDEQTEMETPIWTLIGSLVGVFGAIYQVFRDVQKS